MHLVAVNDSGEVLWKTPIDVSREDLAYCPVMDESGNIYLIGTDEQLLSFSPDGQLRWTVQIEPSDRETRAATCPVVGKDGSVYVGSPSTGVHAFDSQGALLWRHDHTDPIDFNLLLDENGQLIYSSKGTVYALQTASGGPADSWSMLGGNLWLNGNAGHGNVHKDTDSDNMIDLYDNCPNVANRTQIDTDGDKQGDACDSDDDNDGVPDSEDALPLDAGETLDTDGDGIGNNADNDDDGDGVADGNDAFPLDGTETTDTDGDGIGNNADTDDDNDGVPDRFDSMPLLHNGKLGMSGWLPLLIIE